MQHIVGISDMKIAVDTQDVIITYSLGSCVGVTLYDPLLKIGGLVHCLLPLAKIDPDNAKSKPYMFVDTGVMALISDMLARGSDQRNLIVCVAGGANILDERRVFNIGERNYAVLRKILWKNNILIAAEDVGGTDSRTMFLDMDTGNTSVKTNGSTRELIRKQWKSELAKEARW